MILCPATVDIRFMNPCLRLRCKTFGWYGRLMHSSGAELPSSTNGSTLGSGEMSINEAGMGASRRVAMDVELEKGKLAAKLIVAEGAWRVCEAVAGSWGRSACSWKLATGCCGFEGPTDLAMELSARRAICDENICLRASFNFGTTNGRWVKIGRVFAG
jgi:hypothetical protein